MEIIYFKNRWYKNRKVFSINILEAASIIKDSAEKIAQEKGISEEEAYYEAVLIYKDVYEKNKEQK